MTSGLALKTLPCRKVSRASPPRGSMGKLSRPYSLMSLTLAPPGATKRAMYQRSGLIRLRALTCAWMSRMPSSRVRIRFASTRSSRRACSGASSAACESAAGVSVGAPAGCEEQATKNAPARIASTDRLIEVGKIMVVTVLRSWMGRKWGKHIEVRARTRTRRRRSGQSLDKFSGGSCWQSAYAQSSDTFCRQ